MVVEMSRRDEVREIIREMCYGASTPKLEMGVDKLVERIMLIFDEPFPEAETIPQDKAIDVKDEIEGAIRNAGSHE